MRDVYEMIGLLRKALAKQNYNQRDVAKWLGLTESAVSILFSGMRNMKAEHFVNLIEMLQIRPDILFDYKEGESEPVYGISTHNQKAFRELVKLFRKLDDAGVNLQSLVPGVKGSLEMVELKEAELEAEKKNDFYNESEEKEGSRSGLIFPDFSVKKPAYNTIIDINLNILDARVQGSYPYLIAPEELIGANLRDLVPNPSLWLQALLMLKHSSLTDYLVPTTVFQNGSARKIMCRVTRGETPDTYQGCLVNIIRNDRTTIQCTTRLDQDLNILERKEAADYESLVPGAFAAGYNMSEFMTKSDFENAKRWVHHLLKSPDKPSPNFTERTIHYGDKARKFSSFTVPQGDCIINYMTEFRDSPRQALAS
jgi:transcriptional regulator with XRE-family HTH domain